MPEWSRRGASGRPGGPLARPPSWPRRAPSWLPWTPPPTPPRLGTFLLLQKFSLYICPDRTGTVPRDFACFLFRLFLPGKLLADLGAMASPSSPKDKFVVNIINPYLAEVRKHPQVLHVKDGVLRKEDLKGPVKKGSTEDRLKEMEQEVFKYKKMVERSVEDNFDIMNELKTFHKKETKGMLSSLATLEDKLYELIPE